MLDATPSGVGKGLHTRAITLFRIWEVEETQERLVIAAEVLNIRCNDRGLSCLAVDICWLADSYNSLCIIVLRFSPAALLI